MCLAVGQVFERRVTARSALSGRLTGSPEAIDRVRARAGVTQAANSPFGYVDRRGQVHAPLTKLWSWPASSARRNQHLFSSKVEAVEREWSPDAQRPGNEYLVELLNEYRASWALLRQWGGFDAAIAQRGGTDPEARTTRLGCDLRSPKKGAGLDRDKSEAAERQREALKCPRFCPCPLV